MRTACMNDLRSGVCFLLRGGSNTASSFLKARYKVRLFTSIYDFTRIHREKLRIPKLDFDPQSLGGKA